MTTTTYEIVVLDRWGDWVNVVGWMNDFKGKDGHYGYKRSYSESNYKSGYVGDCFATFQASHPREKAKVVKETVIATQEDVPSKPEK